MITVGMLMAFAFGFLGGTVYQKSQQPAGQNRRFANAQIGDASPSRQGPVTGSIVSRDDNTITIQMPDGSTKIVIYANDTKVNKTSESVITELKEGEQITVMGTNNADGTVTAQTILIGGQMMKSGTQKAPAQP